VSFRLLGQSRTDFQQKKRFLFIHFPCEMFKRRASQQTSTNARMLYGFHQRAKNQITKFSKNGWRVKFFCSVELQTSMRFFAMELLN